jgi:hypothetical protein
MARTETFTSLLDRCETPMQTYLILAQLQILRRQDKQRLASERGHVALPLLLGLAVTCLIIGAGGLVVLTIVAKLQALGF